MPDRATLLLDERDSTEVDERMAAPAVSMRGVLHPEVSRRRYSLARFPPGPGLGHLVQHLWVVEWDLTEPFTAHVLPHPNVNLCVMAGRSRITGTGRRVFVERLEGAGRVVGVTYRPGAFRLLYDAPARSLTDRQVPVTAVYDADVCELERDVLPLLDRLNRMVVRNLRTLRELKTKPINMTTANFGQLNLAQTQTNLARSADEESSGIADASGTIINSGE